MSYSKTFFSQLCYHNSASIITPSESRHRIQTPSCLNEIIIFKCIIIFGYSRNVGNILYRKFLVENSDKSGKPVRSSEPVEGEEIEDFTFYNILNPASKIQCDLCKRDVTRASKVMVEEEDYCCSCFANLNSFPAQYQVANKLDYPLFDQYWTACEELLLFEALEKHGFGNWGEISDFIGTDKSREDVEEHYQHIFLSSPDFIPNHPLLTRRQQSGALIYQESQPREPIKHHQHQIAQVVAPQTHRASLTVNQTNKTGNNPAELIGYMPRRGDFEVEFDNDAELILAEMQFHDEDTEQEKAMKFRLIDIYNQKLNERIRRKQFVISRHLLDLRQQIALDRASTKEEREIQNIFKVFSRFSSADAHQALVRGLLKEKQIRQIIEELKEFKKKGFKNLKEVEQQLQAKKKKEEKLKKKQNEIYGAQKITRRMRKDPGNQKTQKRVFFLNHEEQSLCSKLDISVKQFMNMKETILHESVKLGPLSKQYSSNLFNEKKQISDAIYDLLVSHELVIPRHQVKVE